MILLDTDHASLVGLRHSNDEAHRLIARLDAIPTGEVAVSIITIEEQMRGWLAALRKERTAARQAAAYRELQRLFDFYGKFRIASFDDAAADRFDALRSMKLRVGSMDLKIAAICLVNGATLLTRNARDFARVPGLQIEDWTL